MYIYTKIYIKIYIYLYANIFALINTKLNRNFRTAICSRDQQCLITKCDECECDACHLVPFYICEKYEWPFINEPRNGILLTKSLHVLFDRFYWTFDIYDMYYSDDQYWCKLIFSPNDKQLTVNKYKNKSIAIPLECFPFMYVHYQMFIAYNYDTSIDVQNLYNSIIEEDNVFKYLYENELPIDAILNKQFRNFLIDKEIIKVDNRKDYSVNAIIKNKGKDYYFIWWDHLPYSEASWEPQNNLKKYSIECYHKYIENISDS